jgi:predicted RNA-binding protein with RPS1 domain
MAALSNYPGGAIVEGTITNVTDFGIFVQLEEGIEGLVHVSEISKEKIATPVGMYNMGDTLKVKVINVSSKDRKIGLSIKALDKDSSEDSLQDYKKKQPSGPSTIGDLLKTEMESKETSTKEDAAEATPEENAVEAAAEEPAAEAAPEEEVTEAAAEEPAAEAAPEEEVTEAAAEEPAVEAAAEEPAAEAAPEEKAAKAAPAEEAAEAADKE